MGGGMAQLASYGQADVVLTGNPQITYWKLVYRRHTNFSVEAIESAFQGPVDFGKRATVQVPRNGDLVSRMWLQITLPDVLAYDIAPAPTEPTNCPIVSIKKWLELAVAFASISLSVLKAETAHQLVRV